MELLLTFFPFLLGFAVAFAGLECGGEPIVHGTADESQAGCHGRSRWRGFEDGAREYLGNTL